LEKAIRDAAPVQMVRYMALSLPLSTLLVSLLLTEFFEAISERTKDSLLFQGHIRAKGLPPTHQFSFHPIPLLPCE
jgi:hypothetical protein